MEVLRMAASRIHDQLCNNHSEAIAFMVLLLAGIAPAFAGDSYDLAFSTYFGGRDWEHARDVAVDAQGNIYVVGGAASADFPTTPGVYSRTFHADKSQDFGPCDVFVVKFAPDGWLLWSTLIGGPGYDRAYGVEIDKDGLVCLAGRAGPGFPMKNAFQPDFNGVDNGSYGMQNAFVLKLLPDGSDLVWSSYVGVSTLCRDIAVDPNGDVYVPGGRWNTTTTPPVEWYANAFQKTPNADEECGAIKIKGDGSRVLWATWLGGSAQDNAAASIRIGPDGKVFIGSSTFSEDFPTTEGAFDRTYNGQADFFVACLTPDGSKLVYSTYLGGDGNEWISTHNLAVDAQGNAYVAVPTGSTNYPVTRGAFQRTRGGGSTDWAISKLSPTGALLASTLVGGNGDENADGVYVDPAGNVFVTGETKSTDFPVTAGAYQAQNGGGSDVAIILLSADFSKLLYATYLGGPANDNGRSGFLGSDGSFYVVGASDGPGWPVKNAYQGTFAGGGGMYGNGDCILAKLTSTATITPETMDDQAPSIPTDFIAGAVSSSQVTLAWSASTDNVAVAGYKVHRDGVRIGFSSTCSFVDSQVEAGEGYTYEVSAYDTAGNESLRSTPLVVMVSKPNTTSDPLGYWKFDESAGYIATDASDYNHYGTIFKAVRVPGKSGKALDFGGLGNYVQIQTDPALDNLEAITITAWIYPRVDAHWHVLDKGDGDKRLYAEGTRLTLDGRVRYSGTHAYSASASNTVTLNTWQHVAMVWSHTTNKTRLYLNGVEVRYDIQDIGSGTPQDDTDYPFTIGARGALGEATFLSGLLDEVRLYKRALSTQEIAEICGEVAPPHPRR
jgi:hypothetical protein